MGDFGVTAKDFSAHSGIILKMRRSWQRTIKTSRVHKLPRNSVAFQNQTPVCDDDPAAFISVEQMCCSKSLGLDGVIKKSNNNKTQIRTRNKYETLKLAWIWIVAIEFKTLASG